MSDNSEARIAARVLRSIEGAAMAQILGKGRYAHA